MRLILLTLNKDIRRLWPAVAVTWIMLAVLTNADRWRAGSVASPMEGWMNILLTMAWACVAALVVLEEPLVGDRYFWMTRPHRWPALLIAKVVFLLFAVHLPSFCADAYILAARGFSPFQYAGDLISKQLVFFGCVTLPAIALATLVRNFSHFLIGVFAAAACVAMLNGGLETIPGQMASVRHAVVRTLLVVFALIVVWFQYAWRRTRVSRILAVAAACATVSVSALLPARAEYTGARGGATLIWRQLRPAETGVFREHHPDRSTPPSVEIPIAIRLNQQFDGIRVPDLDIEVTGSDGASVHAVSVFPARPLFRNVFANAVFPGPFIVFDGRSGRDPANGWLRLQFSRPVWDRLKNQRVRVRATFGIEPYRIGPAESLPLSGTREVPGVGHCAVTREDDVFNDGLLKVLCESPDELPGVWIRLRHEATQRKWVQSLNDAMSLSYQPNQTWLSPLNRGNTFFHLSNRRLAGPGSQWQLPVDDLPSAQLDITRKIVTGRILATVDWTDVDLKPWLAGN